MPTRQTHKLALGLAVLALIAIAAAVLLSRSRTPGIVSYDTDGAGQLIQRPGSNDRRDGAPVRPGARVLSPDSPNGIPSDSGAALPATPAVGSGADTPTTAMLATGADGLTTGTVGGMEVFLGPDGTPLLGPDGRPLTREQARGAAAAAQAAEAGRNADGTAIDGTAGTDPSKDPEPTPEQALVGGRVVRDASPVEDAILTLTTPEGRTFTRYTNASGYYQFPPVYAGDHVLYLVSPQITQNRRRLQLAEGDRRLNEDFAVPPLPAVQGVVTSLETGQGIRNAEIQVMRGGNLVGSLRSGEEGNFTLMVLQEGDYIAKALADGYLPESKAFRVTSGQQDLLRLTLGQSVQVRGSVRTATGAPAGGALVALFGNWAFNDPFAGVGTRVANPDGSFSFSLPAGSTTTGVRVGAYKEGFVPAYSTPFDAANPPTQPLAITLPTGGSITGRVLDPSGEAIEGAELTVKTGFATTGGILQRFNVKALETATSAAGSFTLRAVEAGSTVVTVAADGYVSQDVTVVVRDNQAVSAGDITLEDEDGAKPGRVFGLITDERGVPMVNHNVTVRRVNGAGQFATTTDSRGGFKIDDIPAGQYAIYTNGSLLRGEDFIVVDQTFPFVQPGGERIYLVYDLGQSIRFRVVDGSGNPVKSFKVGVKLRYDGAGGYGGIRETIGEGFERNIQTSTGEAIITHVIAGSGSVAITVEDVGSESKSVTVPIGGRADLGNIVLLSGGEIAGRVLSSGGESLSAVLVRAVAPAGAGPSHPLNILPIQATTDEGGNFRLKAVPAGTADLQFNKGGWASRTETGVAIQNRQTTQVGTIALDPAAVLSGVVRGQADNQPLANIEVNVQGQMVQTDREGRFYFDQLKPGQSQIVAFDRSGRFDNATRSVNLGATPTTVPDIVMVPTQQNR